MTNKSLFALGATVFLAAGCLTVNVYFPAPEVRNAAEKIVEETWGDGSQKSAEQGTATPTSWLRMLAPAAAYAAEPKVDIDVSTAAIRQLKAAMSHRAEQLKPHLRSGAVGISNQGLLEVRSLDGLGLRDKAEVRKSVDAENRDRLSLYREIAESNGLSAQDVPRIQRIFAETWIDKAETGWQVQAKDGTWSKR